MENDEKLSERRWLMIRARVYEEKIKQAFRFFREKGFEPVLIKGWAAAEFYPERFERVFTDIDLCFSPESYPRAVALYENDEDFRLEIDLHEGLRHLDRLEWDDLFENSICLDLDGEKIRVLRPEDHLRVLCVHWLTDGGAFRERLSDIYHLVKNRPPGFDWDRCLEVVDPNRRDWVLKTISLARHYLSLETADLPFADELEKLPDWLIKALEKEWESGVKLRPLQTCLAEPAEFWRQLKKRCPPNPIQATIDVEGRFDDRTRIFYQAGSILVRLKPSVVRIGGVLWDNLRGRKKQAG